MNRKAFTFIEVAVVILILGILVTVVIKSKKMISNARLNAAKSETSRSPVMHIGEDDESLRLWLDSTTDGIIKNNSSEVTKWIDFSYYGNNIADSTDRPLYVKNGINGLPSLQANGTSDFIERGYTPSLNPDKFTIFVVCRVDGGEGLYRSPITSRSAAVGGYIIYANSSNVWQVLIGNGAVWSAASGDAVTIGKEEIIVADYDASTARIFMNGVFKGQVGVTMLKNSVSPTRIAAGASESPTPSYFFNGLIGEVIIYSKVLTDSERRMVEQYLSRKWRIKLDG